MHIHTFTPRHIREKTRKQSANIKVLDPFAGTGNLMFPAAELGLDVTCSDYNPLAYLIEKASLDIQARNALSWPRILKILQTRLSARPKKNSKIL